MYNKSDNYCTFFPDELFGVNYNYACYLHDRHYRNEIKNRLTRIEVDRMLREIVIRKYKEKNKHIIGFFVGWVMYFGVRIMPFVWRKLYDFGFLPNNSRELWIE